MKSHKTFAYISPICPEIPRERTVIKFGVWVAPGTSSTVPNFSTVDSMVSILCIVCDQASTRAALWLEVSPLDSRDVYGNGIPNGTGNPMGMGIKHRIGNGNVREWETTSVGMGITCTPMGICSFYQWMLCIVNNTKSTICLTLKSEAEPECERL